MLESFNNKFEYKKLTPEEQAKRGILGRLVGVIADSKNPTRNGRKYSKELWENVFNDPIMEEKIKNKVILGELGHPEDRTETDISKAAIVLSEKPKFGKDGKLYGVFDILDTPNGKILKTLCDYGTTLGVSSRGEGDIIEDYNGDEAVDPDTYSCECWDIVLLPAVKEARVEYVTEALDKKRYNKTLRQKLSEEVDKAEQADKEIMEETLEKLDIKLNEEKAEYVATEDRSGTRIYKVGDIYTADYRGKTISSDDFDKLVNTIKDNEREYFNKARLIDEDVSINTNKEDVNLDLAESFNPEGYTKAIKAISDGIENDENLEDIREYLQDIIGYCRSIANDYNLLVESLDEKLVEPTEEDLAPIEAKFDELGLEIEAKGKTLFGNRHYQLRKELDHKVTKEDLGPIFDGLCDLSDHHTMPVTCNVGIHRDGDNIISASVDVDKKYVKDDAEEVHEEIKEEVVDNKSKELLNELTEALKDNSDLKASIAEVQGKLAVSDAKVESLVEELTKYKDLAGKLGLKAKEFKELSTKVTGLEESLKDSEKTIKDLTNSNKEIINKATILKESYSNNKNKLREELNKANGDIKKLSDELEEVKLNSNIIEKESNEKIAKLNNLAESYKKIANETMKKYIESKANMYGLSFNDIRSRLPKSYTVNDVDSICENMRSYNVTLNRLPISISKNKVKFTESKNDNLRINNPADDVDEDLINLANSVIK